MAVAADTLIEPLFCDCVTDVFSNPIKLRKALVGVKRIPITQTIADGSFSLVNAKGNALSRLEPSVKNATFFFSSIKLKRFLA